MVRHACPDERRRRAHHERCLVRRPWVEQYTGRSFDSKLIKPASAPVARDGLLWIYYSGFTVPHNALSEDYDGRIGLARARIDGLCSLNSTSEGALITRPFQIRGSQLSINAETRGPETGTINSSVAWKHVFDGSVNGTGRIQVEIQDEYGHPMPAFEAEDCTPFPRRPDRPDSGMEERVRFVPPSRPHCPASFFALQRSALLLDDSVNVRRKGGEPLFTGPGNRCHGARNGVRRVAVGPTWENRTLGRKKRRGRADLPV